MSHALRKRTARRIRGRAQQRTTVVATGSDLANFAAFSGNKDLLLWDDCINNEQ